MSEREWSEWCGDPHCPCQDGDACHFQSVGGSPAWTPPPRCVWGVDPAVSRISFAFAPVDGGPCVVRTLTTTSPDTPDKNTGARYGLLDRQVRIYAKQLASDFPPEAIWVEQPSGGYTNLTLVYSVGAILAALAETVPVPVWTIPPGTWKKRTLGFGNASKEQIAAWVAGRGYEVASQDEADAIGIALAGRAMVIAGEWEASAA